MWTFRTFFFLYISMAIIIGNYCCWSIYIISFPQIYLHHRHWLSRTRSAYRCGRCLGMDRRGFLVRFSDYSTRSRCPVEAFRMLRRDWTLAGLALDDPLFLKGDFSWRWCFFFVFLRMFLAHEHNNWISVFGLF